MSASAASSSLFAQQMNFMTLWQEACFVAGLRAVMLLADAAAPTPWGSRETTRMWREKFDAAQASGIAAAMNPFNAWHAGMHPYSIRVRRNRMRLLRRAAGG